MSKTEKKINKDSIIQLQQKVIHYKSEKTRLERLLALTNQELENQKEKVHYLKQLFHSKQSHNPLLEEEYKKEVTKLKEQIEEYKKSIQTYKDELENHSNRLKIKESQLQSYTKKEETYNNQIIKYEQLIESLKSQFNHSQDQDLDNLEKRNDIIDVSSIFNYSLILTKDDDEQQILLIGNLLIKNTGNTTLHRPIICIKFHSSPYGKLGGKIKIPSRDNQLEGYLVDVPSQTIWEYAIPNWKEKIKNDGEYWIRPDCTEIGPGEEITFQNFDITFSVKEETNSVNTSEIIEGFIYTEELQKGVPTLNKMIVTY
ncbi:hypothetical protein [Ferdinandcohnia sp. SAFN-114]|uniref:hypothetical protein n=1 Tax=Ferdinandcohnia sp. SAFN-114 TaxID=3387275 RepID=UPI003F7D0A9D